MDEKKLERWWTYRKWSAVILLIVLVAVGYLIASNTHSVSYDFYVSTITEKPLLPEQLEALQEKLDAAAWDSNHDGQVRVLIWEYVADLSADAAANQTARDIEADLNQHRSGLFLTDNPEGIQQMLQGEAIPVQNTELYAILAPGHMQSKDYQMIIEHLQD